MTLPNKISSSSDGAGNSRGSDERSGNEGFMDLSFLLDDPETLPPLPMSSIFSDMNDERDSSMGERQAVLQERAQQGEVPTLLEILDAAIEIAEQVRPTLLPENQPSKRSNHPSSGPPKPTQ